MLREIDAILNKFTMYRVLLYGLIALLVISSVLGLTDAISISVGPLLMTIVVLLISCYAVNKLFSAALRVPSNTESWLLSALILSCLLPPIDSLTKALYAALVGLLAMASKYLLTYRGNHIFNPAAFGAGVVSVTGLLPATWWIATPWLAPFTALLALIVLRKQRRFQLFVVFAAAAVAMLLLTGTLLQGISPTSVLRDAVLSWPLIFFGSIMLTEPATLPPTHYYRMFFAVIVGLLFTSQLHAGRVATTPQAVLLLGNLLTLLAVPAFGTLLRLKAIRQLSPDIYEVSFDRPAALRFTPGQYAEFTLPHVHADNRGNRRTFSITSPTAASEVRFAFRLSEKGSSFKAALSKAVAGSTIRIGHVAGDFTLPHDERKPLLFIAGGIGVTPFHSMVGSLTGTRDIVMLYLASDPESFVYKADFDQAAVHGVKTLYLPGRLTPELLQEKVPDFKQRLSYISGPDGMVRSYKQMLLTLGAKRTAIKSDYFAGY